MPTGNGSHSDGSPYAQLPLWVHERLKHHPFAYVLYVHLRLHYWSATEAKACPKGERLAAELDMSRRTITRALVELRKAGVLATRTRHDPATGHVRGLYFYLLDERGESPTSQSVKFGAKALRAKASNLAKRRGSQSAKFVAAILCTDLDLDLMCGKPDVGSPPDPPPHTHTPEGESETRPPKLGDEFFAIWEHYHGRVADRTRDNYDRLARAAEVYGQKMVTSAIPAFFADEYAAGRGHPVALFVTQIAQLAARTRRARPDVQIRTHVCPHTNDPCASVEQCIDRQTAAYRARAQAM